MGGMKALANSADYTSPFGRGGGGPHLMLPVVDGEEEQVEAAGGRGGRLRSQAVSIVRSSRACARVRRSSSGPQRRRPISIGDIQGKQTRRSVRKAGQPIHLTRKEYGILFLPATHEGARSPTATAHLGVGPG